MFCGSSYKPSLFQQQHIRKSLYLPTVGIVTAAPTMADEPSAPVAQATHAHKCNGDREGSPCTDLSESGASIIDGATERLCQPTTFQSGRTDLGLDPAQASALTEPLPASADSSYDAALPFKHSALLFIICYAISAMAG